MLVLDKVTCVKRDRVLFSDLCFTVNKGELVQIVGANGVGKTSLLRIIAGLAQPYEGAVFYQGQILAEDYFADLLYLGHKKSISDNLTVLDNINSLLQLHSYSDQSELAAAISNFSITWQQQQLAGTLSSGQKQRAALSRLLLNNKKVWILDEPFVALDKQGRDCLEKLLAAQLAGGCVIITSHQALNYNLYENYKIIEL